MTVRCDHHAHDGDDPAVWEVTVSAGTVGNVCGDHLADFIDDYRAVVLSRLDSSEAFIADAVADCVEGR